MLHYNSLENFKRDIQTSKGYHEEKAYFGDGEPIGASNYIISDTTKDFMSEGDYSPQHTANAVSRMGDIEGTANIVVHNTTAAGLEIPLFNPNVNLYAAENGLPTGVNCTVDNRAYTTFLASIQTVPRSVKHMKVLFGSPLQVSQSFEYSRDIDGKLFEGATLNFAENARPEYQDGTILEKLNINLILDGNAELKFTLLANTSVTLVLTYGAKAELGKILRNKNALSM